MIDKLTPLHEGQWARVPYALGSRWIKIGTVIPPGDHFLCYNMGFKYDTFSIIEISKYIPYELLKEGTVVLSEADTKYQILCNYDVQFEFSPVIKNKLGPARYITTDRSWIKDTEPGKLNLSKGENKMNPNELCGNVMQESTKQVNIKPEDLKSDNLKEAKLKFENEKAQEEIALAFRLYKANFDKKEDAERQIRHWTRVKEEAETELAKFK